MIIGTVPFRLLIPGLFIFALCGCANVTSIGRRSDLPGGGTAVHLDAKQRVVIAKNGFVCAEPSPDALSAFASSVSGAIALPNQASASLAQALQESAGSIGLRTQSITLMRDSLYRICEAYYSGVLQFPQVMSLLTRTQNLTLAILAIEQLTGVASAQQVRLGCKANSAASSTLSTNQQLLESAKKEESQKKSDLAAIQTKVAEKRQEVDKIQKEIDGLEAERGKLTEKEKDPKWVALSNQIEERNKTKTSAIAQLRDLEQQETTAKELLALATKTREAIEKNYAVALTQANAAASGFGSFSDSARVLKLNDESIQHTAQAVTKIVDTVVNQRHGEDNCFTLVSLVYDKQQKGEPVAEALVRGRPTAEVMGVTETVPGPLKAAWDYCTLVFDSAKNKGQK